MPERARLALEAAAWSAILTEGDRTENLGAVADVSLIAPALRRRMPIFAREAVRCGLLLLREAPESELVFSSRHGDLSSSIDLLCDLTQGALISPATFSISVHNAAAGLLGQCVGASTSHTAVAGSAASLAAGLTESYARLAAGETESIVLIHADVALPAIYGSFDEGGPSVYLGLRLRLSPGRGGVDIKPDRSGAVALARALDAGARRICFAPPVEEALAA